MSARAMTNGELTATRAPGHSSKLFLTISRPAVVFACQINQTFDSLDGVAQLDYDNATGDYSDVMPGMTCLVGSASGLDDLGRVRIRKSPTDSTLYINPTAEIDFDEDVHLTVLADVGLWSRDPSVDSMDYDVVFSSATWAAPVPILGPIARILERTGATVSHSRDASASYSPVGHDLSYQWYAPGASATSNMDTATPTITYDQDGEFLEYCVVTDIVGAQSIGYRKVFVNPTPAVVVFDELSGDVDEGGWLCSAVGYSGVDQNDLRDGALVVIWSRDYFAAQEMQLGSLPGYENIVMVGWVDGETIQWNRAFGWVDFKVGGPAYWLKKISGAPMFIQDADGVSTSWNDLANLTVDLALYRFIHWQTTIDQVMDVFLTGDTRRIHYFVVNTDYIWDQISWIADSKIAAAPLVNRYGQLYIQIPVWLLAHDARGDLPVVIDLNSSDWLADGFQADRVTAQKASMIELSGTSIWDGSGDTQLFSRAPGTTPGRFGEQMAPYSELVAESQDQLNQISGDYLAHENNEYPAVEISLKLSLRYVDICPRQIVRASIAADDTPRGVTWSNKRLVPLAVSFRQSPRSGALLTDLVCEAETSGRPGVFYSPPQPEEINWDDGSFDIGEPPSGGPIVPGIETWIPPVVFEPPATDGCGETAPANRYRLSFSPDKIGGLDDELSAFSYYPCKLRPSSSFYGATRIEVHIVYSGDALGNISAYAIDASKNRIATLNVSSPYAGDNWTPTVLSYGGISELDVAGFEIALNSGGGIGSFKLGAVVSSGSVNAQNESGASMPVVPGNYYALQNTGGPWYPGTEPPRRGWTFAFALSEGSFVGGIGGNEFTTYPNIAYGDNYGGFSGERLSIVYGRVYLLASGNTVYFRVADSVFDDNSGSLGYILRRATPVSARQIKLGSATIYNVCTAG